MKKIIGRGVLLLNSTNENGLKFGYILNSEGIQLTTLGNEKSPLKTLSEALSRPSNPVTGTGHLILNALPSSPNHAFYDVTFTAIKVGKSTESFTIRVRESQPFAHGPQYHFSKLDMTFTYDQTNGLSILPNGKITLNLDEEVFENNQVNNGEDLKLTPEWNTESETLIFKAPQDTEIQMESIGTLNQIVVEMGESYDRWANVQGLYTFVGTAGDIVTHDISGQGAPSLYFQGEKNPDSPYGATWLNEGIKFSKKGVMASLANSPNSVVESIKYSKAFSVEMWIKSSEIPDDEPAWIFGFRGKNEGKDYAHNFFLGQDSWANAHSNVKANFKFPPLGIADKTRGWETPLKSPANSLSEKLTHVVYTCDQDGMQRIFINGVLAAQRHDPEYYNKWGGNPRIVVGSDLIKKDPGNIYEGKPWSGRIQQLAIFNRALTVKEVNLHYLPSVKITGDFSLNNVISPLKEVIFPFNLLINKNASSLVTGVEGNFNIKTQLGIRKIYLECNKLKNDSWHLSGRFQTRFWEDLFDLHIKTPEEDDTSHLLLIGLRGESDPINITGIGVAKYQDILLKITAEDVWDLSFGEHQEYGLISMVLENSKADYGDFRLGRPHLVLDESITLEGSWLEERMVFISSEKLNAEGTLDTILKGSTAFDMLFSLTIPATVHETSGIRNGEDIKFVDEVISIALDLELQKEGFFATLNSSFTYTNPSGNSESIKLAERFLYQSPASKNALLEDILEEIKAQADTLFVELRSHKEDYFIKVENDKPRLHYEGSSTSDKVVLSMLPDLFEEDTTLPSKTDPITIIKKSVESDETSEDENEEKFWLQIKVEGINAENIDHAFETFFENKLIKNLSSAASNLLKRRIIERLPLDYKQVLAYHYGWNIEGNYLDLQPGMRLRIDFQNYQFVQASDPTALRGFAGSGGFYININSYTNPENDDPSQLLGFGPFISRLQSENGIDLNTMGAGGVLDLLKTGNRKAFYRLVFPNQLESGTDPERSVTIIGADDLESLDSGTTNFIYGDTQASNSISFFFRGKATIVPEIQVYVSEQPVYVPVGTTIRQLIEMYDYIPEDGLNQDLSVFLGKSRPLRRIHEGANNQPEYRFINFPASNDDNNSRNLLDLPLIKGDRFYF